LINIWVIFGTLNNADNDLALVRHANAIIQAFFQ